MAVDNGYLSIIGPEGKKDFEWVEKKLATFAKQVLEIGKGMKAAGFDRVNSKSFSDAAKAQEILAKSQVQMAKATLELQKVETEYQRTLLATQKIRDGENRETERTEKNRRKEEKATKDASDAYKQLSIEHKKLEGQAKILGALYGAQSKQFLEAAAASNELRKKLDGIDQALGNHQRNVGNYGNKLIGVGYILRELPNAGISATTFFSSISNNLIQVSDDIDLLKKRNAELIAQGKTAIPIWKSLALAIISWQTALNVGIALLVAFGPKIFNSLTGAGQATERLNASMEGLKNQVNDLSKSYADLNLKLDRSTKLMVAQAKASGATQQEIRDIETKAMKDRIKLVEDEAAELEKKRKLLITKMNSGYYSNLTPEQWGGLGLQNIEMFNKVQELKKQAEELRNELKINEIKPSEGSIAALKEQIQDVNAKLDASIVGSKKQIALTKQLTVLQKQLDSLTGPGAKPTDLTNEKLKSEQDLTDELYQEMKLRAENEAEANKFIADNENETLERRLAAFKSYTEEKLRATGYDLSSQFEQTQQALDKITAIEKKSVATRTDKEKNLLLQKDILLQRQINLFQKYKLEELKLNNEFNHFKLEQEKKYGEDQVKAVLDGLDKIKNAYHPTGNKKNDFQTILSEQIQYLEEFAAILAEAGVNVDELNSKIDELKAKLAGSEDDWANSGLAKGIAAIIIEAKQLVNELAGLVNDIYDRKLDKLDQEGRLIEENGKKRIDEINKEMLTQEQKEEKIRKAEAQTELQRRLNESKKRQATIKQARFQRVVDINNIIASTALAVLSAFQTYKSTPYAYVVAAINAGIGLAQLTRTIAQPLPAYWTGVDSHPGGPAIMGEKGVEKVIEQDGRVWFTRPTATIYPDLAKGATVIPHDQLMRDAQYIAYQSLQFDNNKTSTGQVFYDMMRENRKNTDRMVKAVGKQKVIVIDQSNPGFQNYIRERTKS